MSELLRIHGAARAAHARREAMWLATVMRVHGSAYRHAGARLLFTRDRVLAGSVSGGCLEANILRKAPWLVRERSVCVRYEGGRDDDDDGESPRGTGCDGAVDVLLERATFGAPGSVLDVLETSLVQERRCALVSVFESSDPRVPVGARLALRESGELSAAGISGPAVGPLAKAAASALAETRARARTLRTESFQALLEVLEPPPHLFVFGSGPDALPLVQFASALGLGVTVCDPQPRVAVRERFATLAELHLGNPNGIASKLRARRRALGVVMSHHYPTDSAALRLLLESPALYIGLLGPRRRSLRLLSELFPSSSEQAACALARLRSPIGLDLGAETPEQIALSIVAEIQAVLARASARPLSECGAESIHRPESALELPFAAEFARTGTS